eukprot:314554-Amphidinium_carterae.1
MACRLQQLRGSTADFKTVGAVAVPTAALLAPGIAGAEDPLHSPAEILIGKPNMQEATLIPRTSVILHTHRQNVSPKLGLQISSQP